VATNYVQFRVSQQRIHIAEENVRIQEGVLALTEKRFNVGTATRVDVEQARTILEQTRSTIPALQNTLGQASDRLCILLGMPPQDLDSELGPGAPLGKEPMAGVPDWVAVGVPADLLRRRPDVRRAEAAACITIGSNRRRRSRPYPAIFINGTVGLEASDLSHLFESKSFFGNVTPTFRWKHSQLTGAS